MARPRSAGGSIAVLALATAVCAACGKKGPPLPPLVRVPAPPPDVTASRRGSEVDLQFTVPGANTDGTRPANIAEVDVYAFSGPPLVGGQSDREGVSDAQLLKLAAKIKTIPVKAPRDPNLAIEPDEPTEDIEPPEGRGLDQNAVAHVEEQLTAASLAPVDMPLPDESGVRRMIRTNRGRAVPLLAASAPSLVRTYAVVGLTPRGRRGPVSKRVSVPLSPPPPPPSPAVITYTETSITVSWEPPVAAAGPRRSGDGAGDDHVLPSKPLDTAAPKLAFNVYEWSLNADDGTRTETKLTPSPVAGTTFADNRVAWGVERCYVVRTVEALGNLSVESDSPAPSCTTFVDTFPPAPPKGLKAVPGQGSVSLIWEPNSEKDLAGYIVLRGPAPGDTLEPITPEPIRESTFTDTVPAGVPYLYAVRAVDKAGNMSALSNREEGTARH